MYTGASAHIFVQYAMQNDKAEISNGKQIKLSHFCISSTFLVTKNKKPTYRLEAIICYRRWFHLRYGVRSKKLITEGIVDIRRPSDCLQAKNHGTYDQYPRLVTLVIQSQNLLLLLEAVQIENPAQKMMRVLHLNTRIFCAPERFVVLCFAKAVHHYLTNPTAASFCTSFCYTTGWAALRNLDENF